MESDVSDLGGTQIGAYRIVRQIGTGGMGAVYLAEHVTLQRPAALKVLHPEFSTRPEMVTRFFNEARAATAISDPGIVQIFDFGQHTDGSAFIVMELLDGETLDERLRRLGALAVRDALRIMRQATSTLAAAHARGIIHRDVKPENIFIVRDPEVAGGERAKVLDFGIAKLAQDQGASKTQTAAVMGTPLYMSPEQCRGAGLVDQRSDVYSLGCVLFTLITGRPPFDAEGVGDIIAMHLREPATAPSLLRAGIPIELDQLVLRCLAKDPAQRYATAGELAIAIRALSESSATLPTVPEGTSPPRPVASAPTTLSSATGASLVRPASRRASGVAVLAGLAVVAGAVTIIATRGDDATHDRAPTEAAARPARTPAPPAGTAPVAVATPKVDPNVELATRIEAVFARFVDWSRGHAGAPCPDAAALDAAATDSWGHPFRITCTDQPGDQIIGVISAGPDGVPGTADDIASWQLDRDVVALVRGPRWVVAPPPPSPVTTKPVPGPAHPRKPRAPAQKPVSVQLDDNGLPISR